MTCTVPASQEMPDCVCPVELKAELRAKGDASLAGGGGREDEGEHDARAVGAGHGAEMRAAHHQRAGRRDDAWAEPEVPPSRGPAVALENWSTALG